MEYLHTHQIIHRDIKSQNLLVDKDFSCKISDFGISTIKPKMECTMTSVGTPAYMAPEVINKNRYTEKADIYSFGILLIELYTGSPPYSDDNKAYSPAQLMYLVVHDGLRPVVPDSCPKALQHLIHKCLHGDFKKRPSFIQVSQTLSKILHGMNPAYQV